MAKVLVADDSRWLLHALVGALRSAGHSVTSTDNGADAVCLIKSAEPKHDLLILDMVMPGLSGHEVLKALGDGAPPVIVISGRNLLAEEAAMPAVKRVLNKPFDLDALEAAIASAVPRGAESAAEV